MPAPKGNKYAKGHHYGRPLMFKDPNELQSKIDEYFDVEIKPIQFKNKDGELMYNKDGSPYMDVKYPTVTGLALFLGFVDRRSIYDYKEREDFSRVIKKAIAKIERMAEENLFKKAKPTGEMFWLKNHGWFDKINLETKQDDEQFEREKQIEDKVFAILEDISGE